MRSFLNAEEPRLARWLVRTWDNQQTDITYAELRNAVLYGDVSLEQLERWQLSYSELVNTQLAPAWQKTMNEAAWNLKHQFPNFFYDPFMDATQDYIRKHGAELVTNIVNSQREAIRSMVSQATFYETAITPDALSRFIRPTIGLTRPQAMANLNYWKAQWDTGAEMGLSVRAIEDRANRMAANYAARQHRYRAMMIARTELADAYNHGAYFGTLDAQEKGYLGACKKIWVTAFDERVCPTCSALDGVSVNMDAMFPGGVFLPPKHPNCRCGVEFRQVSVPIVPTNVQLENVDIDDIIEPGDAMEYESDGMGWDNQQEDDRIVWPEKGEPITTTDYRELRTYANDHDILLSGFRNSDVDIELMKEVIDDAAKVLEQFPELGGTGRKKLTLMLSDMSDNDFSMVYKDSHILRLNSKAYRSKKALAEEYAKLADEGWFVRGTDYHSIVYHELGHVYANKHGINGMDIVLSILETKNEKYAVKYLREYLSQYSVSSPSWNEIISEIFSSYFSLHSPKPDLVSKAMDRLI